MIFRELLWRHIPWRRKKHNAHCVLERFTYLISLNLDDNPMAWTLLPLFYKQGHWDSGTETLQGHAAGRQQACCPALVLWAWGPAPSCGDDAPEEHPGPSRKASARQRRENQLRCSLHLKEKQALDRSRKTGRNSWLPGSGPARRGDNGASRRLRFSSDEALELFPLRTDCGGPYWVKYMTVTKNSGCIFTSKIQLQVTEFICSQ